jgi:ElaB/YqjD/DUF883 family membrane-anchored ribosome-binding protein
MAETPKWKESDVSPPGGQRTSAGAGAQSDYSQDLSEIRDEISRISDTLTESIKTAAGPLTKQLEGAVTRNPIPSVLIAAGIGLLLGLSRRR